MYYGRVKFFDSKKNNFGFITDILHAENLISEDLYISGNDIRCSPADLKKGVEVCFDIVGGKKKKAVNLVLFSSLDFSSQLKFALNFDSARFQKFLSNNLESIPALTVEEKNQIGNKIIIETDTFSYSTLLILSSLENSFFIDQYFNLLSETEDSKKLLFINYNSKFINYLLKIWNFDSEKETLKLFDLLSKSDNLVQFSPEFIERFLNSSQKYSLQTKLIFFALVNDLNNLYLLFEQNFKPILKNFNDIVKLIETYSLIEFRQDIYNKLINLLSSSKWKLDISVFSDFLSVLQGYFQNKYLTDLSLEYISIHKLSEPTDFQQMVQFIKKFSIASETEKIVMKKWNKIKDSLDDHFKLNILDFVEGDLLRSVLLSWKGDDLYYTLYLAELALTEEKFLNLSKELSAVISKSISLCSKKNFSSTYKLSSLFDYIKKFNDLSVLKSFTFNIFQFKQEFFFSAINFYTDDFIKDLIKYDLNSNFDQRYSDSVKLIYFFLDENYIPKFESFKKIIPFIRSSLQVVLLKRLVYLYSLNKISKNLIDLFFNVKEWTTINNYIIINFIKHKPSDRRKSLDLLSDIFFDHFSLIDNLKDSEELYEDLFKIGEIVKKCNGRKIIPYKEWKKDGITRKYVKSLSYSICSEGSFFCEGRYWKREKFYISGTNNSQEVNVYWCRGAVCYGINSNVDLDLPYYDWTLLEIAKVFGYKIDHITHSTLSGWANRINEIIVRLRCRECKSFLRPVPYDPNRLGHYATPVFNCLNSDCSEYKKVIRITHCLNGKCLKTLDSRDLKTCDNGWLICDNENCKTCCPVHFPRKEYFDKFVEGYPIDDF